ncbi:hypothetical protein LTR17_020534 [Elasticomyces elasticus]|nr:hypothetical protein LTR17_020534 [Elasticomyces elasticus]
MSREEAKKRFMERMEREIADEMEKGEQLGWFDTISAMATEMHSVARTAVDLSDISIIQSSPTANKLREVRFGLADARQFIASPPDCAPKSLVEMMGSLMNLTDAIVEGSMGHGEAGRLVAGDTDLCAEMRSLLGPIEQLVAACKKIEGDRALRAANDSA